MFEAGKYYHAHDMVCNNAAKIDKVASAMGLLGQMHIALSHWPWDEKNIPSFQLVPHRIKVIEKQ